MCSKSENPSIKLHNPSSVHVRGRIIIVKDEKRDTETALLRNVLGYLSTLKIPRGNQIHIKIF